MKYLKLNLKNPEKEIIAEIVMALKNGKVIALPTDTIYGLSCLASAPEAIRKISKIKNRPLDGSHHYSMLVSSVKQAEKYVLINYQKNIAWKKWRSSGSPTTVMLASRKLLSKEMEANREVLSLRLPAVDFLRKIIKLSGAPLVSTSFNLHGQEVFSEMEKAYNFFKTQKNKPDLIIDGGKSQKKKSSILVDLSGEKELVLRK